MSKRNYSNELNELAETFNNPIVDELKKSITGICEYYQISLNDLCKLCDIDNVIMENLMHDGSDGDCLYDLRTISLLTLLSNGRLSVLNDTPSAKEFNAVNCIIKDYQDENNPTKKEDAKKPSSTWEEKILEMLEMFGVKDINDLDHLLEAVKSVKKAINEHELTEKESKKTNTCCNGDKCKYHNHATHNSEPLYVDENGNFNSQKSDDNQQDTEKVKGIVYDSETMDKPKEFEFTGNIDKLIPNFFKILEKFI